MLHDYEEAVVLKFGKNIHDLCYKCDDADIIIDDLYESERDLNWDWEIEVEFEDWELEFVFDFEDKWIYRITVETENWIIMNQVLIDV